MITYHLKNDKSVKMFPHGYKSWHLNHKYHRTDGPAVTSADGIEYWYLNGREYSEEEYAELTK